jgi:hypothetical protein
MIHGQPEALQILVHKVQPVVTSAMDNHLANLEPLPPMQVLLMV